MDYQTFKQNQTQFLALTSLLPDEFETLLNVFTPNWERYYRYRTLEGKYRQQPAYQERVNATLKGNPIKLLFLLIYFKTNALKQHLAASFGVSQTKISRMAIVLLDVLNQTLAQLGLLPVCNADQLATTLCNHPHKVFSYDGTERGVLRNTDYKAQVEEYSAKKERIG